MDMHDYYSRLKETAIASFKRVNNTTQEDSKHYDFSAGSIEVHVTRGDVLEKAATSRIQLKTKNPLTGEDTQFDVFQVKTYPASPKIPIMLFNMENRTATDDIFAGFLDVAPVAACKEDIDLLHSEIKELTESHAVEYEPLRKKLDNIYKMDHWDNAVNAAAGIRLELPCKKVNVVQEAGLLWLKSYCYIVKRRETQPYNIAEEECMYTVRRRILEFYMLKDVSFKVIQELGAPIEAMSEIHFAPVIKY